jgi:hypothetical protein
VARNQFPDFAKVLLDSVLLIHRLDLFCVVRRIKP